MISHARALSRVAGRAGVALLLLLGLTALGAHTARGAELIPSVGLTRSVNGDADAKAFGGIAVRGDLLPFLQDEIGVSYRSESVQGGLLKTRMWPVTASLWLKPVPFVYGGAGVGWYNTTYDYNQAVLGNAVQDVTKQQFGVHVGGGLRAPLTPAVALELNGRYVMMRNPHDVLVPEHFNPDFWTASAGLAFHF